MMDEADERVYITQLAITHIWCVLWVIKAALFEPKKVNESEDDERVLLPFSRPAGMGRVLMVWMVVIDPRLIIDGGVVGGGRTVEMSGLL